MKISTPIKGIFLIFFLGGAAGVLAQPANDDCANATPIADITNWCSAAGEYTNVAATPTNWISAPSCFSNSGFDVWFSFVPTATDVTITIRGATGQAPGGTILRPEVALFSTDCNNFNELQCEASPAGYNIVELYKGGLTPGQTYYFAVQGKNNGTGTFQICIKNYNPPVVPGSDCASASILCDKSAFTLQEVIGNGNDPDEAVNSCLSIVPPSETNSTWFVWTAKTTGTLTFKLTPSNVADDLDFAVYKLPGGIDDCSNKVLERCMASGDFTYPSPCMGVTGLSETSTDISEPAGCNDPSQDNYVKALDMVIGESYALIVNNFTSTGNGFSIEFGGTGEILGPDPDFHVTAPNDTMCLNGNVTFTDASTFVNGSVVDWQWNFGAGATPATASGPGPHNVSYNSLGAKPVVLTIKSEKGCQVSTVKTLWIVPLDVDTLIQMPTCNGGQDGAITLSVDYGTPPYQFNWGSGFQLSPTLSNIPIGNYPVAIKDNNGCSTNLSIPVHELELILNPFVDAINPPSCFDSSDGSITVTLNNGLGPYSYSWAGVPVGSNVLSNIAGGSYTVTVTDANLCHGIFNFDVVPPPPLVIGVDTLNSSCYGSDDASATAHVSGGVGNYSYFWSSNATDSTATNLVAPGQYFVTATDGNGCEIESGAFVVEPAQVFVDVVRIENIICYGDSTGLISVIGSGGTGPYTYSLEGDTFQIDTTFREVPAGTFTITVQDSRGCTATTTATLTQPQQLVVDAGPDETIDLGFGTRLNAIVVSPPFRPVDFLWSPGISLSDTTIYNPDAFPVRTTTYTVTVTDEDNCTATDALVVNVQKIRPIYIPNAFSPDDDGINDFFTLYGNPAAKEIKVLQVFDRWGTLLFERKNFPLDDPILGWNGKFRGKPLPPDVFTYYAIVHFIDDEDILYKGDISIVK